jgi:hypothetical protein
VQLDRTLTSIEVDGGAVSLTLKSVARLCLFESARNVRVNATGSKRTMNDTGQSRSTDGKTCSVVQPRCPGPWSKPGLPAEKSVTNPMYSTMTPPLSQFRAIRRVTGKARP